MRVWIQQEKAGPVGELGRSDGRRMAEAAQAWDPKRIPSRLWKIMGNLASAEAEAVMSERPGLLGRELRLSELAAGVASSSDGKNLKSSPSKILRQDFAETKIDLVAKVYPRVVGEGGDRGITESALSDSEKNRSACQKLTHGRPPRPEQVDRATPPPMPAENDLRPGEAPDATAANRDLHAGATAPDATIANAAEPDSSSSPNLSSDGAEDDQDDDPDGPDDISLTWSETSLVLEDDDLRAAVDRLHTLYRQAEARQRLTGDRLRTWQTYEFEAIHNRMDLVPSTLLSHSLLPKVTEASSSRQSPDGHGRSAGLLCLLHRHTFQELRDAIWHSLDQTVQRVPARHSLLICGDFNSTLGPHSPIAGPSATRCADNHDAELTAVMRRQALTTNTWHCRNSTTYFAPSGASQIDFILMRQLAATHRAKHTHPLTSFPVGATRLTGHHPLQAQLPIQPFYHQRPSAAQTSAHNSTALQQAVRHASPEAQELRSSVAARLREVDVSNLLSAHAHVNRILLEETRRLFPPASRPDHRISAQPGYRTLARSVWAIYRRLKHQGVCTFRNIFAKWRLAAQFARASHQLRQQSKVFKKQYYELQVDEAEAAAARGDQRCLHLIVRKLSPKTRHIASRLRGPDGALLSKEAELQSIVQHSKTTFAVHSDDTPLLPLAADYPVESAAISAELQKLGLAKAVPKHVAPSATWKLCASSLGEVLSSALSQHFKQGHSARLEADWKDSYVVWIPKPNKPPVNVASLRPIGLTSPASKALAGSLRTPLLDHLQSRLKVLPQFAYAQQRGTADAVAKAHQHFHEVDGLLQRTKANRFQQQAGLRHRKCAGGLSLSLDLSRAFDGVTRSHIYQAMQAQGVPPDVITIVQQLHKDAQYKFQVSDIKGSTVSTNGIKQGCVIAPYLWNYFTLAFLAILESHRDLDWLQRVLSLFADDVWGAWLITSKSDLETALADVSLILSTLENLNMTINYSKTAILLKLAGKDASRIRRAHTFMKAGQLHLKLTVNDRECSIPIKEQHEYLGTIVTYSNRLERNMTHRIKACQLRYQGLRKLLNGSHHLSTQHRIRLWRACVCTSVLYSQHIVGVTWHTLQRLTTLLTRHLRAIMRIPAHLTHISNHAVWTRAQLPMPGWQLQHSLHMHQQKLLAKQATQPDITTTPKALEFLRQQVLSLETILLKAAQHLVDEPSTLPLVTCPKCDQAFTTENAMRIHCSLQHKHLPQVQTKIATTFDPAVHSQAGMPECRLCRRQFFRWTHLKQHIESSACQMLGGASHVRSPMPDAIPAAIKEPPTASHPIFEGENSMHLPLVQRRAFLENHQNTEKWLAVPAVRQELMRCTQIDTTGALNEEAEIFAGYWDSPPDEFYLSETAPRSQKRQKPEPDRWNFPPRRYNNHPSYPMQHSYRDPRQLPHQGHRDQLDLLSKVVLKQEEIISRLRHEKIFVLFMKNETHGSLGTLMKIAKDWRNKKNLDAGTLQSPLRTVLLASMLQEVMNLAQQAVATTEAKQTHVQSEWLTAESAWNYRVWNHTEKRLQTDTNRAPLQHEEAIRLLTFLIKNLKGEAIQHEVLFLPVCPHAAVSAV
ncbi:RNA-directed DNA polymerase from mobile element jockey [Symbiodinium microadriaticum]|uniref:RNA-directed DNA polymerase from mobile element jockey n=1 Tax=Symbiodinium microadriaticum TaxID=2951 RepID=A0A1Q9ERX2_SYMMI|nr:RNA-directed DNA polymerase from mobile element jockey [Symbiodinium microadriaticum]